MIKRGHHLLGEFQSSYASDTNDTVLHWLKAYKADPDKFLVLEDRKYSRIIHSCAFYAYEGTHLLVAFEPLEALRTGNVLVDEEGREFIVKSFEEIRFAGQFPAWYADIPKIVVQGKDYTIGSYLRKR